jgi:hypothetical protein
MRWNSPAQKDSRFEADLQSARRGRHEGPAAGRQWLLSEIGMVVAADAETPAFLTSAGGRTSVTDR